MAFIGFVLVVFLGVVLLIVGLGVLYMGKLFGAMTRNDLRYACLMIGLGAALLYFAATHAPFVISMKPA